LFIIFIIIIIILCKYIRATSYSRISAFPRERPAPQHWHNRHRDRETHIILTTRRVQEIIGKRTRPDCISPPPLPLYTSGGKLYLQTPYTHAFSCISTCTRTCECVRPEKSDRLDFPTGFYNTLHRFDALFFSAILFFFIIIIYLFPHSLFCSHTDTLARELTHTHDDPVLSGDALYGVLYRCVRTCNVCVYVNTSVCALTNKDSAVRVDGDTSCVKSAQSACQTHRGDSKADKRYHRHRKCERRGRNGYYLYVLCGL